MQIALVIGSFGVLAFYESQTTLTGNSINVAGKNRFLTSIVILEAEQWAAGSNDRSELDAAINNLDSNIDNLKSGGSVGGQQVSPLPIDFLADWQAVDQRRDEFKELIFHEVAFNGIASQDRNAFISKVEQSGLALVSASDDLVRHLSDGSKEKSESLIQLQIALLVVNVAVHFIMLYLIVQIVKPIIAITKATDQVRKGNLNVAIQPGKGANEVSNLTTSFKGMVESLKKADEMQTNFINIAAHELRTPVQPLIGVADMLQENLENSGKIEITKEELEMIIRNAARLDHLSFEMLEASRIEAGKLMLRKELIDLGQTVSDAVKDAARYLQPDSAITVNVEQPTEILAVKADKKRVSEVIAILVTNAIKFTERGSIKVIIERQGDVAKIKVVDSGRGIDPEILPRLFRRFATNSGVGLGLFIAKNIVESHGGNIWAENNKPAKGATFSFTLPVHIARNESEADSD